MKRITALGLGLVLLCLLSAPVSAAAPAQAAIPAEVTAPSAILMEKTTGQVLCGQNATAQYEPASVTKIMTLLLVMEAIDSGNLSWDDMVTASPHAISMGGSQIWLKENEQLSVRDMVKAVTVVSANDCAVALAEHVAGSMGIVAYKRAFLRNSASQFLFRIPEKTRVFFSIVLHVFGSVLDNEAWMIKGHDLPEESACIIEPAQKMKILVLAKTKADCCFQTAFYLFA